MPCPAVSNLGLYAAAPAADARVLPTVEGGHRHAQQPELGGVIVIHQLILLAVLPEVTRRSFRVRQGHNRSDGYIGR